MATNGIRTRLIALQKDLGLSSREMAQRLGITESRWCHIRNDVPPAPLSLRVIRAAVTAFPDLARPLVAEMTGRAEPSPEREAVAS